MKNEPLTAVLVDDEEHCTDTLSWLINEYCPDVRVLQVFNDPAAALKYLQHEAPDLLFLDIEMPVLNGFDLLKALGPLRSGLVFTTAYDEFAIKAIKHHALDYLLKPVDKDELRRSVASAHARAADNALMDRVGSLLQRMAPQPAQTRIAVPTREGLEMLEVDRILYAKADDNYTELHLEGQRKLVVSRTLKDIEQDLPSDRFMRIHLSYSVALPRIQRYVRGTGGYVVLSNGEQLPVSRSNKDELLRRLGSQ